MKKNKLLITNIYFLIVILLIIFTSVGYASINIEMSISGEAVFQVNKVYQYGCTKSVQSITAQWDGNYILEVWGAQGGGSTTAAKGGYSRGTVYLNQGTSLYIVVGCQGVIGTTGAGYNGGGNPTTAAYYGGGGATDIRINTNSLYARVIVAGGGGGFRTSVYVPGGGGGLSGISGTGGSLLGLGGTQTAGGASQSGGTYTTRITNGSFGLGGSWIESSGTLNGFAGGGGGWFGGGGGHGAGGGSGFVFTDSSNVSSAIIGGTYLLGSNYYLKDTVILEGTKSMPNHTGTGSITGNTGNGYAKITYIGE